MVITETARLLGVLVRAGSAEDARQVLHEQVVLRRADGTEHRGRAVVAAMFDNPGGARGEGARYRPVAAHDETVVVVVEVPGVPGSLRLEFSGRLREGLLVEVSVEPAGR